MMINTYLQKSLILNKSFSMLRSFVTYKGMKAPLIKLTADIKYYLVLLYIKLGMIINEH